MNLKIIPLENCSHETERGRKQFNPGQKIKKSCVHHPMGLSLKSVCMNLIHFINRGNQHTIEHLEKMIVELQRLVLWLQKTKGEMVKNNAKPLVQKKKMRKSRTV